MVENQPVLEMALSDLDADKVSKFVILLEE